MTAAPNRLQYHQVLLLPTITQVPITYETSIEQAMILKFKIRGSFDSVGAQLMVASPSWLNGISVTIFLPPDADLLRGINVRICRPSATSFTTVRYRCAALQNGPAEVWLQANNRIEANLDSTVLEYIVCPQPRVTLLRPRQDISTIQAGIPSSVGNIHESTNRQSCESSLNSRTETIRRGLSVNSQSTSSNFVRSTTVRQSSSGPNEQHQRSNTVDVQT